MSSNRHRDTKPNATMTNKENKIEVSLQEILEGMAEAAERILPIVEDKPDLIAEINRLKREVHELKYGKDTVYQESNADNVS